MARPSYLTFQRGVPAQGYVIESWFNDEGVPEATRYFIRDLATTFQHINPFGDDIPENDEILNRKKDIFVTCYGEEIGEGLTFTYLLDAISISFLTDPKWDKNLLEIIIHELPEDSEDFIQTKETIRNISRIEHLLSHENWVLDRLKFSIGNGSVLLTKISDWYPHLIFCKTAKKQLKSLKGGVLLQRVIKRLFELEEYCNHWDEGGFNGTAIPNSSNESQVAMEQYGKDREFVCPDGKSRIFEFHLKGLPNQWRIHIWPDENEDFGLSPHNKRKILIGYIGEHLPIVSNST